MDLRRSRPVSGARLLLSSGLVLAKFATDLAQTTRAEEEQVAQRATSAEELQLEAIYAGRCASGALIWEVDTGRESEAINGRAQGGQIAAYPIQVVDGFVYVTSGASSRARPGNALLVFGVPK